MAAEPSTPPGPEDQRTGRGLGLATRVQVAAHSFMARRANLGLTRRQVRMETDPGRRESMAILGGITLTAVICLAALFWSFLRPAGSAGTAPILADQKSGALYVRVGDTLYPALNLASARLIAGEAANPVRVRRSEIEALAAASFAQPTPHLLLMLELHGWPKTHADSHCGRRV